MKVRVKKAKKRSLTWAATNQHNGLTDSKVKRTTIVSVRLQVR